MATVERSISVPPAQVFSVLADGWSFTNWVVGTSHMRAVDESWPAEGSRLHHASGNWPFLVRDETVVNEVETDRKLVLTARAWPFGEARVSLELTPEGSDGTRVTMTEAPSSGPGKWLHNPVAEAVLVRRNVESLARLAALAERRTQPAD